MKIHPILATLLLVSGCLVSNNSFAWGRHGGFGVYWGAPYYGYGYGYPYPYPYYPPAVVTVPVAPPTYVQQQVPLAPPQQVPQSQQAPTANYWHYCNDPAGYYPYIKECPGGWQLVPTTPH
jgi:hypothetical protein